MFVGQKKPTHIVCKNKQIQIWHYWLDYVSNAKVIRASKLVDGINIKIANVEYKPKKVFIDSDLSKTDKQPNLVNKNPTFLTDFAFLSLLANTTLANFDQLCGLYVKSESTRTILQKYIILTFNKLEEVYADLWDLNYPSSLSGKIYSAILYCKFK